MTLVQAAKVSWHWQLLAKIVRRKSFLYIYLDGNFTTLIAKYHLLSYAFHMPVDSGKSCELVVNLVTLLQLFSLNFFNFTSGTSCELVVHLVTLVCRWQPAGNYPPTNHKTTGTKYCKDMRYCHSHLILFKVPINNYKW